MILKRDIIFFSIYIFALAYFSIRVSIANDIDDLIKDEDVTIEQIIKDIDDETKKEK
jgi:1,4-dihydroxy-2-naphthoate octaprenyltransferase